MYRAKLFIRQRIFMAHFCFAKTGLSAPIPRLCPCKACGLSASIQAAWASSEFANANSRPAPCAGLSRHYGPFNVKLLSRLDFFLSFSNVLAQKSCSETPVSAQFLRKNTGVCRHLRQTLRDLFKNRQVLEQVQYLAIVCPRRQW
jgi:hypothetical protein